MNLSISVLIPTYNRAEILRETLEAMCKVDISSLKVNFIVIENGLRDCTQQVVESYGEKLPVRYLYESNLGKNNALNKAIKEESLGEVIVCTDDDVIPNPDWLKKIVEATERWPKYDIFGGAIYSIWPDGQPPKWWGAGPQGSRFGLSGHGQGISENECLYPLNHAPCGANMWVRKPVFNEGYRFDGTFGRNTRNNTTGDETSFLHMLRQKGYELVYSPYPVVGHRIQKQLLSPSEIKRRVISQAKGGVRIYGLPRENLLQKHTFLWFNLRLWSLIFAIMRYISPINYIKGYRGYAARLEALCDIAYNVESFRIFRDRQRTH